MILKIAVCDDNDKDIEIINRELLLLEEKAREKGCTRYRHLKAEMIS